MDCSITMEFLTKQNNSITAAAAIAAAAAATTTTTTANEKHAFDKSANVARRWFAESKLWS